MSRSRDGYRRRGVIALAAATAVAGVAVFLSVLIISSPPATAAVEPQAMNAATKEPTRARPPKVKATINRGQLNVLGTAGNDRITLSLKPGDTSRVQVNVGGNGPAEFTFKRRAINRIVVHGAAGADALSINEGFGAFTRSEATSLFGDKGDDLLRGGSAAERLFGGRGNDSIDAKRGNDLIEGGTGSDLVVFTGSSAADVFEFSATGNRLRFAGAGTMTIAHVERFDLRASDGADTVIVNDLSGAGLDRLNADLANDGAADVVEVRGSSAANELRVSDGISIDGIGATVDILHARAANDQLKLDAGAAGGRVVVEGTPGNDTIGVAASAIASHIAVSGGPGGLPIDVVNADVLAIDSLAGNDTVDAGLGLATLTQLTLAGGAGGDAINGGDGNDTLLGGDGNDAIDGNGGDDVALMGADGDSFTWDPGDGSDRVEGQAGSDTMVFNGAGAAENFEFSANGNRLNFFRTQGAITMDTAGVERVDLHASGGSDNAIVNDLSATDLKNIELDLDTAIGGGAGDGAVDTTTVNGTGGKDATTIAANAGEVEVTGLAAAVRIEHVEGANDLLNVNGSSGNDTISGAIGLASLIKVGIDGGAGEDTITGGDGNDTLGGGDGNDAIDGNGGTDVAFMGAGDDAFTWDPGDGSDVVEGQDGVDSMVFNGADVAEQVDLSANGTRLRFFRTQGAITMDTAGVERVDFNALGGADLVTVNDLSASDVTDVRVDLAGTLGGASVDGQADRVVVNATDGQDAINVQGDAEVVKVSGLFAGIAILHPEFAIDLLDQLEINTLAGVDAVDSSGLLAGVIQVLIDGVPD